MKRICTFLLTLVLIFSYTSTIYGETTAIESRNLSVEDIVGNVTADTTITLIASSRLHATHVEYKLSKESIEAQKGAIKAFLERLIDLSAGKQTNTMIVNPQNPSYDYVASIRIVTPSDQYDYQLSDNHLAFWNGGYDVDNPWEIIAYFVSAVQNELTVLGAPPKISEPEIRRTGIDFETQTWDSYSPTKGTSKVSFSYKEKLQFDVLADDSYYDTVIEQVSDAGKEIHCTIEQISTGNPVYILTLEGNRGKKQFVQEEYSWSFSGSTTGNELEFALNHIFDGTNTILYDSDEIKPDRIGFKGETANGGISKITMSFTPYPDGLKKPNELSASNIQYEYYGTEEQLKKDSRNLVARFGIQEKDIEIKKPTGNDVQPQDPEHYVTEMRGVYEDGTAVIDFYIDFMAKTKLSVSRGNQPLWFSVLGDNVEISIISIVQTLNGSPRRSYPMIRFKGDRGIQWFDVNTVEAAVSPGEITSHVKDDNTVYLTFNSMLSFEGFTKIKNTVSYDTFSIYMRFVDTEKTELKSIEMNLGNQTVTIDARDINYTGGGKGTYENWW